MASAQLTTLVDAIVSALNTAPNGTWSDLTIGTGPDDFAKAMPCLDPEHMFEADRTGLYVIPVTMLYEKAASQGRGQIIALNRLPVIALCLLHKLTTPDESGLDISSWPEVKKSLNLREEIDLFVLRQRWGWDINSITAEPAQEIPLKAGCILSITEIEFSGMTC
jgi:hypothetical protein